MFHVNEEIADGQRADCCQITRRQSQQDGFDLVRVGAAVVCGACLVEAGVIEEEPES